MLLWADFLGLYKSKLLLLSLLLLLLLCKGKMRGGRRGASRGNGKKTVMQWVLILVSIFPCETAREHTHVPRPMSSNLVSVQSGCRTYSAFSDLGLAIGLRESTWIRGHIYQMRELYSFLILKQTTSINNNLSFIIHFCEEKNVKVFVQISTETCSWFYPFPPLNKSVKFV